MILGMCIDLRFIELTNIFKWYDNRKSWSLGCLFLSHCPEPHVMYVTQFFTEGALLQGHLSSLSLVLLCITSTYIHYNKKNNNYNRKNVNRMNVNLQMLLPRITIHCQMSIQEVKDKACFCQNWKVLRPKLEICPLRDIVWDNHVMYICFIQGHLKNWMNGHMIRFVELSHGHFFPASVMFAYSDVFRRRGIGPLLPPPLMSPIFT